MENTGMKGIKVMRWNHDVTLKNLDDFRIMVWKLLDSDKQKLILDLSGVAHLNSPALGVIADAVLVAGRNFKQLVVTGVQPTVGEIFKIVRFGRDMSLFESVDIVLWSFDRTLNKLITISPACRKVYGYPPEAFYENQRLWLDVIHPDDQEKAQCTSLSN